MHILRNVLSTVLALALVAAFCPGLACASELAVFDGDTSSGDTHDEETGATDADDTDDTDTEDDEDETTTTIATEYLDETSVTTSDDTTITTTGSTVTTTVTDSAGDTVSESVVETVVVTAANVVVVTGWNLGWESATTTVTTDGTASDPTTVTTIVSATYDTSDSERSTSLVLPDDVTYVDSDDAEQTEPVTALADQLFYYNTSTNGNPAYLYYVTIPESVTEFGTECFRAAPQLKSVTFDGDSQLGFISQSCFQACSRLTTIELPASVKWLGAYAFTNCTKLKSVTFLADEMEFLGSYAFEYCTALTTIDIPPLTGGGTTYRLTNQNAMTDSFRLGYFLFYGCTSLCEVTLLPGVDGSEYFSQSNGNIFTDTADDFAMLVYVPGISQRSGHAADGSGVGNASNRYYAVSYYADVTDDEGSTTTGEERAEDDTYGLDADYQALYAVGTTITDILSGEAECWEGTDTDGDGVADKNCPTGEFPETESGKMLMMDDESLVEEGSTLADTMHFFQVDISLEYAYVSVPTIVEYSTSAGGSQESSDVTNVYIIDGWQDLSEICVYLIDGTLVDPANYTLVYLVATATETSDNGESTTGTAWEEVSATEPWEEGIYSVYANGNEGTDYEGTTTGTADSSSTTGYVGVSFDVTQLTLSTGTANVSDDATVNLGNFQLATCDYYSSAVDFITVADVSSPTQVMLATWLAGVAGGQAFFTDGDDTPSATWSALSGSQANRAYIIGGEAAVGSSVVTKVKETLGISPTQFTVTDATDAESMANRVWTGINTIEENYEYGYEWSTTAIVASGNETTLTASLMSFAWQDAAPVFFTSSSGTLSSTTLSNIKAGGFERVLVAGSESLVSASVLSSIQSAVGDGVEVSRIAGEAATAYEASVEIAELCDETFTDDDGEPVASATSIVVAPAGDAADESAAIQYAIGTSSTFLAVSTSADAKEAIQRFIEDGVTSVVLFGDFSEVDSGLISSSAVSTSSTDNTDATRAFFTGAYDSPVTALEKGDTFEASGLVCQVTGESTATRLALLESGISSVSLASVKYGETTYTTPTAVGASFFAGCTKLASVTGSPTSVGASAFKGCTKLASVTLSSATSIGASAFQGCTKLSSATLTAATSIGASAFSGCTALTSFSAAKVTTLAASVLSGCSALKTLSIPAVKSIAASQFSGRTKLASVTLSSVTTVGANAFKGCKALKTVALPKATTIGNAAFSGCTAMTKATCAKVTKIGSKAFYGCKKLTAISTKAKTIGASAFQGCSALKTATLSSTSLTAIPATLFSGCKKLTTLTIKSAKVKKVGSGAFKGTLKSLTVKVPKSKVKTYQKLFVSKGLNKKAKVR